LHEVISGVLGSDKKHNLLFQGNDGYIWTNVERIKDISTINGIFVKTFKRVKDLGEGEKMGHLSEIKGICIPPHWFFSCKNVT